MTYKETKQYGAHYIIYTTFYGYGHYIANDREENYVTGNEFFTEEEAKQRIVELKRRGYVSGEGYQKSPRPNTNTYELWPDAGEYLDDLITEEG